MRTEWYISLCIIYNDDYRLVNSKQPVLHRYNYTLTLYIKIPLFLARMFALSNGPKLLCDKIQTGSQIFIPESGHTSECNSDSVLDTSSTTYLIKQKL